MTIIYDTQPPRQERGLAPWLRRGLLLWLTAVTVEYMLLEKSLRDLSGLTGIAGMNPVRVVLVAVLIGAGLFLLRKYLTAGAERMLLAVVYTALSILTLTSSFTWPFFIACLTVQILVLVYALRGWRGVGGNGAVRCRENRKYARAAAVAAVAFFALVGLWTACRVFSFSTPTFDFGIFAQMFYNMKETGLPMTTVERDGLLSHFAVHMSPIYYLMLPFYCLMPTPATLQVLQAAVMTSAVIPLWKICKLHGLSGLERTAVCTLLLLYPAFSGGVGYDIHENCFLTPLVLWLLYGIDKKSVPITAISAVLTLLVKEDAAVYVGIIAVWLLLRGVLRREKGERWNLVTGGTLLISALCYFFAVTGYLAESGDGVMTYRYNNFIYDKSASLVTVIKAVVMNPMKALFECVDPEKLKYIGQTMLPLLGLPLLTRRFERYVLLIPYILINLMSDYQYQHDIFFQYNFGSTACLVYLVAVNLADLRVCWQRLGALAAALIVSYGFFTTLNLPKGMQFVEYSATYQAYYDEVRAQLDKIPDGASVAATTFYTTHLSQREVLYDVQYCSREHLLSAEYVALSIGSTSNFKKYGGYEALVALLEQSGYTLYAERPGTLTIWNKSQTK